MGVVEQFFEEHRGLIAGRGIATTQPRTSSFVPPRLMRQPRKVVEQLNHGSSSNTSCPSAVGRRVVSRPSNGTRERAHDAHDVAQLGRGGAHTEWGSVATTRSSPRSPFRIAGTCDPLPCRERNDALHRADAIEQLARSSGWRWVPP